MKHGLVMLAALALVLLAGCAAPPTRSALDDRWQASLRRGQEAFARGDLATAEREYRVALLTREAVNDAQGRALAQLSLARVLEGSRGSEAALRLVQDVLADAQPLPASLRLVAHARAAGLLLQTRQLPQAGAQLDHAVQLCEGRCEELPSLELLQGRLALARGEDEAALQWARQALRTLDGRSVPTLPAHLARHRAEGANARRLAAQALMSRGDASGALALAQLALQIDQELGQGLRVAADLELLARAHAALGNTAEAARHEQLAARARAASRALDGRAD